MHSTMAGSKKIVSPRVVSNDVPGHVALSRYLDARLTLAALEAAVAQVSRPRADPSLGPRHPVCRQAVPGTPGSLGNGRVHAADGKPL